MLSSQLSLNPTCSYPHQPFSLLHTSDVLCLVFLFVSIWQDISRIRIEYLCLYHAHIWHIREKCQQVGTGKRAQQLRMFDASVESLGLAPSTQLGLLTTTYNYSPWNVASSGSQGHLHIHGVQTNRHTHICTNLTNLNKQTHKNHWLITEAEAVHTLSLHLVCSMVYPKEGNTSPAWPLWFLLVFSGTHQTNK